MKKRSASRGSALLTAIVATTLIFSTILGLLAYVQQERARAISASRSINRVSCADAGLQVARAYFIKNHATWNTYLADPSHYNPVLSAWNTTPANPALAALQTGHPELFIDLDGDTKPDVFIYIRDNADELPPAAMNWAQDNDQNVFVGAICISSTLVPRRQDGTVSPELLTSEGLLSYNISSKSYCGQGFGGANGSGNLNGCL
jgi:hypothetical protein